jgi:hypothetical protein
MFSSKSTYIPLRVSIVAHHLQFFNLFLSNTGLCRALNYAHRYPVCFCVTVCGLFYALSTEVSNTRSMDSRIIQNQQRTATPRIQMLQNVTLNVESATTERNELVTTRNCRMLVGRFRHIPTHGGTHCTVNRNPRRTKISLRQRKSFHLKHQNAA